ncbi:MAG: hypothetical protein JSR42_11945 [Proteobacteria bacterium]|nr:hypothetical protein [Pseudomonadota bacterium]MBS0553557.1 hypothetical protein [Pseudomonadota bacterium]
MSSTVSPGEPPFREGFAPALCTVEAECDGGRPIEGTHFAGRQSFTGRLTGHYRDYGPYPWRWYLLASLTRKPEGFAQDAVWCDAASLYLVSDPGRTIEEVLPTE